MLQKNTAGQFMYFVLVDASDGSALTGASPAGAVSKDGAAQGAVGGSFTEQGGGQYEFAMAQADTNADEAGYLFTAASAVPVNITVTLETKKMADLNDVAVGALMGLSASAITAAKFDLTTAYPLVSEDASATRVARTGADGDTLETLSDEIALVPDAAQVNAQVDLALTDIHLDHLLAANYDPAAKPGIATALFNELIESDGGVSRYTANALEQGPNNGDATAAKQDEILVDLVDIKGTAFSKDTDSLINLAHTGADSDTLETLSDEIAAIPDAAGIQSECNDALVALHLDHLLSVAYAGEGQAGSLLEDLTEDNAGTYRFTEASLTEAPSGTGGDASAANQTLLLEDLADLKGSGFVKDTDSMVDLAHTGADADTLETLSDEIVALQADVTYIEGVVDDTDAAVGVIDGIVDAILVDTATTIPGTISTIDTVVAFVQDILEGDKGINDDVTPWRLLIRHKDTKATLVEKELFEVDGTTNIVALTGVIGAEIKPA